MPTKAKSDKKKDPQKSADFDQVDNTEVKPKVLDPQKVVK